MDFDTKLRYAVLGFLLIAFLNIAVFPLLLLWCLNTLFALNLGYTILNWFAAWMLISCFRGAKSEYVKN